MQRCCTVVLLFNACNEEPKVCLTKAIIFVWVGRLCEWGRNSAANTMLCCQFSLEASADVGCCRKERVVEAMSNSKLFLEAAKKAKWSEKHEHAEIWQHCIISSSDWKGGDSADSGWLEYLYADYVVRFFDCLNKWHFLKKFRSSLPFLIHRKILAVLLTIFFDIIPDFLSQEGGALIYSRSTNNSLILVTEEVF